MVSRIPPTQGRFVGPSKDPRLGAALQKAEKWMQGPPPLKHPSPERDAAQMLIREITALMGHGATVNDLQKWFKDTFETKDNATKKDIYWHFPGISAEGATLFCSICHVEPQPMTPQDKILHRFCQLQQNATDADKAFYSKIVHSLSKTHDSSSSLSQIVGTADGVAGPNFQNFPGLSQAAKNVFLRSFGPPSA